MFLGCHFFWDSMQCIRFITRYATKDFINLGREAYEWNQMMLECRILTLISPTTPCFWYEITWWIYSWSNHMMNLFNWQWFSLTDEICLCSKEPTAFGSNDYLTHFAKCTVPSSTIHTVYKKSVKVLDTFAGLRFSVMLCRAMLVIGWAMFNAYTCFWVPVMPDEV